MKLYFLLYCELRPEINPESRGSYVILPPIDELRETQAALGWGWSWGGVLKRLENVGHL